MSEVSPPNRLRTLSRRRTVALLLVVGLLFGVLAVRLTQLQVVSADRYTTIGESQRINEVTLSADRGSIFDRYGNDLAESVPQSTIWVDPKLVKDPNTAAALLSPILGQDISTLTKKLTGPGRFGYIQRKVNDDTAAKIKELKLAGIYMYDEPKRFLPGEQTMASVLGQVGIDNDGLSGLELQYNEGLTGVPGKFTVEQDLGGRDIPGGINEGTPAERGDDLVLTLDSDLQYKVEDSLSAEITRANAKGGIAAVMDTKTGEVLALANLATKDGKKGGEVVPATNNIALTNVYEPGSTSKLITASAALETGIVNPSTPFSISDRMQVADSEFKDSEDHPTLTWNTTDIITASSNIGTIKIGQMLGKDRLDQFQRNFGYGTRTDLKFPGESAGLLLDPDKYSGTSLATTAIGQGVSVTAMQMLAAYNTIANNGMYVGPKLVKATIDGKGTMHDTPASESRRVVSETTATQMNLMLQEVVRVGTATAAQIDGYNVAGKTGTARKPKENGSGYQTGAYVSSFAGFVPAGKPQLTVIVLLDEPTPIYGGLVAAPVFSDISRYALQKYNIAPADNAADRKGVPYAAPSVSSTAGHSDAKPGTTAEAARALTEAANAAADDAAKDEETTTTTGPPTTLRATG